VLEEQHNGTPSIEFVRSSQSVRLDGDRGVGRKLHGASRR